jgi:hypothetical protein
VNFDRKQIIRRYLRRRSLSRMSRTVSEFLPSLKQLALCCVD